MRTRTLLPLAILALITSCKKNDPDGPPIPNNQALTWAKTFGGSQYDFSNATVQLSTGEYITAGTTRSTDGDLSGARTGYDSWLQKIGTDGSKLWSKAYGNTSDDEYATSVAAASDGSIYMAGYGFNTGTNKAWVVKAGSDGTKIWEKQILASTDAKAHSIIGTSDGGAIVAGYEGADAFMMKLDASGNTAWKKNFGGSGTDVFTSMVKSGSHYILAGHSSSASGDLQSNKGAADGWVLKADENGNKIWSVSFGGSDVDYLTSLVVAPDGGIAAAGYTKSNGGDIPGNKGGNEAWILKLDGSGNKSWIKTFGGANEEYIVSIVNATGGGFIILGHTNSTTGDVKRTFNDFGGWLLKVDANGAKTTASTYGESADDFTSQLIPTADGGYLITGHTDLAAQGRGYDGWILKVSNL